MFASTRGCDRPNSILHCPQSLHRFFPLLFIDQKYRISANIPPRVYTLFPHSTLDSSTVFTASGTGCLLTLSSELTSREQLAPIINMYSLVVLVSALLSVVTAHMQLNYPPTFNSSNNPHTTGTPDPFLYYPYDCCGRTTPFPCRGYLSLLGKPEGAPVASWAAGSKQQYSLTGLGSYPVQGLFSQPTDMHQAIITAARARLDSPSIKARLSRLPRVSKATAPTAMAALIPASKPLTSLSLTSCLLARQSLPGPGPIASKSSS